MLKQILAVIEPVQLYIFLTFLIALLFFRPKNSTGRLLFLILMINAATEFLSCVLLFHQKSISLLYSVSILLHHSVWLLLLSQSMRLFRYFKFACICFGLFGIFNLCFMEGIDHFNFNTFILGALIYIVLFIYESFSQLKQENFDFFLSNHYLLLFAPVLYLFGVSFVFGFKSKMLAMTVIFGNIGLYSFIVTFVNIIYYTLIIVYIYRDKKLKHVV